MRLRPHHRQRRRSARNLLSAAVATHWKPGGARVGCGPRGPRHTMTTTDEHFPTPTPGRYSADRPAQVEGWPATLVCIAAVSPRGVVASIGDPRSPVRRRVDHEAAGRDCGAACGRGRLRRPQRSLRPRRLDRSPPLEPCERARPRRVVPTGSTRDPPDLLERGLRATRRAPRACDRTLHGALPPRRGVRRPGHGLHSAERVAGPRCHLDGRRPDSMGDPIS